VAPELFVTGFNIGAAARDLACAADGPEMARIGELARRHRIALCVGYPERAGDAVYDAAAVIGADGAQVGSYRKHRLSGPFENSVFQPGQRDDLVFSVNGVRIGVLVCYDVEFPENVRRLALAGVDAVVVPTALSAEFALVARKLVPTRAFENGIFVVYADRCGEESGKRYAGLSCIVAPDGTDLARAGEEDALVRARIAPRDYDALRKRLPYLRDLRAG
jgi:predicted amidohydrolase